MIQFQRVSTCGDAEVWHLHAAVQKLYRLGEAHCSFDHAATTTTVSIFMSDNCPRHRDLVDYFLDQVIPADYSFMVRVYSRGIVMDSWNSADQGGRIEDGITALERAAAVVASRLFEA